MEENLLNYSKIDVGYWYIYLYMCGKVLFIIIKYACKVLSILNLFIQIMLIKKKLFEKHSEDWITMFYDN